MSCGREIVVVVAERGALSHVTATFALIPGHYRADPCIPKFQCLLSMAKNDKNPTTVIPMEPRTEHSQLQAGTLHLSDNYRSRGNNFRLHEVDTIRKSA